MSDRTFATIGSPPKLLVVRLQKHHSQNALENLRALAAKMADSMGLPYAIVPPDVDVVIQEPVVEERLAAIEASLARIEDVLAWLPGAYP